MFTVTSTTYQGGTSQVANLQVPYPATPVAGDLLFLFVSRDSTATVGTPAGWNLGYYDYYASSTTFLWKIADGTETGNLEVDRLGSSAASTAVMSLVHSSTGGKLYFDYNWIESGSSTTPNPPSITVPFEPSAVLFMTAISGMNINYDVTAYPTGYNLGQADIITDAGTSSSYTGCAICAKSEATSNTDDPEVWTMVGAIAPHLTTLAVYEFEILSIDPAERKVDELGTSEIKIKGDLTVAPTVKFDGVESDYVELVDAQTLIVTTPVSSVMDDKDLLVEDSGVPLSDTLLSAFSYTWRAPSISSVTPDVDIVDSTVAITIKGENFRSGLTLTIGGVTCTSIVVVDSNTVTAVSPTNANQTTEELLLTNDDAQFDTAEFSYMEEIPSSPQAGVVTATFQAEGIRYNA